MSTLRVVSDGSMGREPEVEVLMGGQSVTRYCITRVGLVLVRNHGPKGPPWVRPRIPVPAKVATLLRELLDGKVLA